MYLGVVIVVFTPLPFGYSTPIFCCAKHPAMLRGTAGEKCKSIFMTKREVPLSILSPPYLICDELWEREMRCLILFSLLRGWK